MKAIGYWLGILVILALNFQTSGTTALLFISHPSYGEVAHGGCQLTCHPGHQ